MPGTEIVARWAWLLLASLLCGCGFGGPDVWIYVDNGPGDAALTVQVDTAPPQRIPVGKVLKLASEAGARRIVVKAGDETLFEKTAPLGRSESRPGRYLVNPHGSHYVVQQLRYGAAGEKSAEFAALASKYEALPAGKWLDVSDCRFVLSDPIEQDIVVSRSEGNAAVVRRLCRASKSDHGWVEAVQQSLRLEQEVSKSRQKLFRRAVSQIEKANR